MLGKAGVIGANDQLSTHVSASDKTLVSTGCNYCDEGYDSPTEHTPDVSALPPRPEGPTPERASRVLPEAGAWPLGIDDSPSTDNATSAVSRAGGTLSSSKPAKTSALIRFPSVTRGGDGPNPAERFGPAPIYVESLLRSSMCVADYMDGKIPDSELRAHRRSLLEDITVLGSVHLDDAEKAGASEVTAPAAVSGVRDAHRSQVPAIDSAPATAGGVFVSESLKLTEPPKSSESPEASGSLEIVPAHVPVDAPVAAPAKAHVHTGVHGTVEVPVHAPGRAPVEEPARAPAARAPARAPARTSSTGAPARGSSTRGPVQAPANRSVFARTCNYVCTAVHGTSDVVPGQQLSPFGHVIPAVPKREYAISGTAAFWCIFTLIFLSFAMLVGAICVQATRGEGRGPDEAGLIIWFVACALALVISLTTISRLICRREWYVQTRAAGRASASPGLPPYREDDEEYWLEMDNISPTGASTPAPVVARPAPVEAAPPAPVVVVVPAAVATVTAPGAAASAAIRQALRPNDGSFLPLEDEVGYRAVVRRADRGTQNASWATIMGDAPRLRRYVEFLEGVYEEMSARVNAGDGDGIVDYGHGVGGDAGVRASMIGIALSSPLPDDEGDEAAVADSPADPDEDTMPILEHGAGAGKSDKRGKRGDRYSSFVQESA